MSNIRKEELVNSIMNYLQDRLEKNDTIRLKRHNGFFTVDEVYQNYLNGIKGGYASNLDFINNYHKTRNGKRVVFTDSEKNEIYEIVKDYLMRNDISDYPEIRGNEYDFIISILRSILESCYTVKGISKTTMVIENAFDSLKTKLSKYIVALECLETFLDFESYIIGFIIKDKEEFTIEDHKKKKFIRCTQGNIQIDDFTPVVLSENVYVITVLDSETGEENNLLATSVANIPSFKSFERLAKHVVSNYQSTSTLHDYLEANNCLFLERDSYEVANLSNDVADLNSSLKGRIDKYLAMSEEEKDKLDSLAEQAAEWLLLLLETVNFCSPNDVGRALELGYLNLSDFESFRREESLYCNALKDAIKDLIISKNPNSIARILTDDLYFGVFKRASNKSTFLFKPVYPHLKKDNGEITYEDKDGKRVTLVPKLIGGLEDMLSMHDLLTSPLRKEMDIYDGNIFVNNAKQEKVAVYSTSKDYNVLKRN